MVQLSDGEEYVPVGARFLLIEERKFWEER